jgi:chromosome segregation ATPase
MLFELLPHFARLLPMADKFLATRGASEKAHEAALAALAQEVRGELGQVTDARSSIDRQMRDQSLQISEMAVEVTRTRMGIESMETRAAALSTSVDTRIAKLEKRLATTTNLLWAAIALLSILVALLVILLLRR